MVFQSFHMGSKPCADHGYDIFWTVVTVYFEGLMLERQEGQTRSKRLRRLVATRLPDWS